MCRCSSRRWCWRSTPRTRTMTKPLVTRSSTLTGASTRPPRGPHSNRMPGTPSFYSRAPMTDGRWAWRMASGLHTIQLMGISSSAAWHVWWVLRGTHFVLCVQFVTISIRIQSVSNYTFMIIMHSWMSLADSLITSLSIKSKVTWNHWFAEVRSQELRPCLKN